MPLFFAAGDDDDDDDDDADDFADVAFVCAVVADCLRASALAANWLTCDT
jgi:hypothetical protein